MIKSAAIMALLGVIFTMIGKLLFMIIDGKEIKLDYILSFISNLLFSGQLVFIMTHEADENSLMSVSVFTSISILITIFMFIKSFEVKPYVLSMTYIFVCSIILAVYLYTTYGTFNNIPDQNSLLLLVANFMTVVSCTPIGILIGSFTFSKPRYEEVAVDLKWKETNPEVKEDKVRDQLINDIGYDRSLVDSVIKDVEKLL